MFKAAALLEHLRPHGLFDLAARTVPSWLLSGLYRRVARGLGVTLCLHRVGPQRPGNPYPDTTAAADEVDALLKIARPRAPSDPRLLLSFDDGYADAVAYVASRAEWYPEVEWLVFVCPEKLVRRAGFRWDLYEVLAGAKDRGERTDDSPAHLPALGDFLIEDADPERENRREALREVAACAEYALATIEECQRLARRENVAFGNHTDSHFPLTLLTPEQAELELAASTRRFESLFGPARLFAFPYGLRGVHWNQSHVEQLMRLASPIMWSTDDGLWAPEERQAGNVLPRIVFRGAWSAKAMVLWMSWCALRRRLEDWRRLRRTPAGAAGVEPTPVESDRARPPAA